MWSQLANSTAFEQWLLKNPFPVPEAAVPSKALLLDLDDTLMGRDFYKGGHDFVAVGSEDRFLCKMRPGLKEFLLTMRKHYKHVAIFTSSSAPYAKSSAENISNLVGNGFYFNQVLSREQCGQLNGCVVKCVSIVPGFSLADVVLLEDDPLYGKPDQHDNILPISPWGPKNDFAHNDCLSAITSLLVHLSQVPDSSAELGRLKKQWIEEGLLKKVATNRTSSLDILGMRFGLF